jgi:hypothetical protein
VSYIKAFLTVFRMIGGFVDVFIVDGDEKSLVTVDSRIRLAILQWLARLVGRA